GHDPIEWGPNLRHSNMDIYTGDGQPDTSLRPENGTPGDSISLLLEMFLKLQNDQAVAAIQAAGSTTVDYSVHKGSHHFEFWRPDLKRAIGKGLFNPVAEQPKEWTYVTSSKEGRAWDIDFRMSEAQTKPITFTRSGKTLSATGDGAVLLSDGNGCRFEQGVPFSITLSAKPCRKLAVKVKGRLKSGKKRSIRVTVTSPGSFGRSAPADAAKVKLGGKTATTDGKGRAVIKVRARKKTKRLTLVASMPGHSPAKKKLKVGR
ncbi:MAG: hypothetical protein M3Y23_03900, partial [Actinomycetota bacterium]|nr:hypothetical protein [Actinomycetota bacterium]